MLLHAFPLNRGMWTAQVAALAPDHRVLAPDLPGFGETPFAGAWTMDSMADQLAALLDARQIERTVVCGCSLGGYLAFAFYRRRRERVRALVLANTRAEADTEEGRQARLGMAALARREGPPAIAERMLPRLLGRTSLAQRPEVVALVRDLILQGSSEGIAAAQEAMAERADSRPLLPEIVCPARVIFGSEDELIPLPVGEAMAAATHADFCAIPNAGHLANLEAPGRFNELLGEFLARLPKNATRNQGDAD